ncbi:hypothetical protein JWZ98_17455 [Methylomonas sp. EFPC1]|uniref:hypothetical protein n=1 Tax=Methylomonas sp. EFPC1 TaxID=2812647 RepID=UPI0019670AF1|nr:hypothetical protein [Methylomonas sp. EFPC1]QSB00447.1 hypothetical protein JWZ98_17455 [Methylomonas sp. EFPC1]
MSNEQHTENTGSLPDDPVLSWMESQSEQLHAHARMLVDDYWRQLNQKHKQVIITDLDKALPNRIADPERIQQLFQTFGLINDEHAIAIHDELFAAEEINWLPSQIRHINRQLTQQALS